KTASVALFTSNVGFGRNRAWVNRASACFSDSRAACNSRLPVKASLASSSKDIVRCAIDTQENESERRAVRMHLFMSSPFPELQIKGGKHNHIQKSGSDKPAKNHDGHRLFQLTSGFTLAQRQRQKRQTSCHRGH